MRAGPMRAGSLGSCWFDPCWTDVWVDACWADAGQCQACVRLGPAPRSSSTPRSSRSRSRADKHARRPARLGPAARSCPAAYIFSASASCASSCWIRRTDTPRPLTPASAVDSMPCYSAQQFAASAAAGVPRAESTRRSRAAVVAFEGSGVQDVGHDCTRREPKLVWLSCTPAASLAHHHLRVRGGYFRSEVS